MSTTAIPIQRRATFVAIAVLLAGLITAITLVGNSGFEERSLAAQDTTSAIRTLTVDADDIHLSRSTAGFVGCIFGVGVPIGVAWSLATNPAAIAWLRGGAIGPKPAIGAAAVYLGLVYRSCKAAFPWLP